MRKATCLTASLVIVLAVMAGRPASAQENAVEAEVRLFVDEALRAKTMSSGTLDMFDKTIDKVRNLRLLEHHDGITERGETYFVLLNYRDIHTGDIVTVEVEVVRESYTLSIEEIRIKEVKELNAGASQKVREYTDEEVQAFMRDYLNQQTQFNDGKLMLYDKDAEKMRNLELVELKVEVRRLGVLISSSLQFKDVDSGEILDIDISVENKEGQLRLQALRIRGVRKGP